ncbi:glucose/sorbosone dehydrogenase-like protein [Syntrophotalea carbinolica DSM 2380]|uniref:Glucose/sorbosone dehydrogenase-like protein n=1 Tax=Syntrophotalea carbinolica (strain DSM 2380 / NBRC 103641 / GraBd1) TaxID=338963 RepID=Q3A6X4_SYNC1|nr:PQQ-dependent sugar dehydrogenase [Syntrophotalea carbinolica]ABA87883.2 glucose/sorbosone dehydrogenase-like protein [Syntrophotalea carbinolica DSM 2380]
MSRILLAIMGFAALFAGCLLARALYLIPDLPLWYCLLPLILTILAFGAMVNLVHLRWAMIQLTTAFFATLALTFVVPRIGTLPAKTGNDGLVTVPLHIPPAWSGTIKPESPILQTVPGFEISVFASGLTGPRMLAFSPAGDLYVSLPRAGRIMVLPDENHDGVADRHMTFADDLDLPHGLAFAGQDLIAAENGRLIRLPDGNTDLRADRIEVLSNDLPVGGGHWTRSVAIGPTGDYFVAAGSSCNACMEKDPRRAAILRIPAGGGQAKIHARGLRNSVGLAFHPATGELWASNNGRDRLGDDLPPEEINRIVPGGDYGWPFCYGRRIPDPDYGSVSRCRQTLPPEVEMQAHSAPLGITFGHKLAFPKAYRDMLYVAFHGSWNRSIPTGYKLVGIPVENGRPTGPPQDIVRGWLQGRRAWGRPVSPAVGPDGALYLSDDRAGLIYRITAMEEATKITEKSN